jgi:hypothetical protein
MVSAARSFVSHCDLRAMWGLPKEAKINGLTITWPSGKTQEVQVTPSQEFTLVEPR